ncbi:MAG: hypothetical protein J6T19_04560 [Paludibacteraceae bacterium]|nr:hypothetical protein [Paludibacteraceae bacterium]
MKYKLFILAVALLGLTACDKHDFFDDLLITGEIGPQAYWEIESSVVSAGGEMGFTAQYYTSLSDVGFDRSEVWYNLTEKQEKNVSCPWVSTFTYAINSTVSEEKRVSQKIATYPHDTYAQWSDSLHAFTFSSTFPISGTLSPFSWIKPTVLEEDKVVAYFGDGFMEHFKDSLYKMMKYADFTYMYKGLGILDDFTAYTDTSFDANTNSYIPHFKWNADSTDTPVPEKIKELYNDSISFADLIYNTSEGAYAVEYKRSYNIRALMRVYDSSGVYGQTIAKDIDVN